MKKNTRFFILSIAAALFLSSGLLAQEKTEVTVKLKKDGKVVIDTTYLFDDMDEAKHALEMMDLVSGDDIHKEHIHYNVTSAHAGSGEAKTMVFISEDGETTEITEFSGDSNVWVTEEDGDTHGKKVIVMKSEDGDVVKTKEVKVIVSGDEDGNWTVVEGDEKMMDMDENIKVIVIKKSVDVDCDHDEDHDHDEDTDHDSDHEEEIEVKVIKKK